MPSTFGYCAFCGVYETNTWDACHRCGSPLSRDAPSEPPCPICHGPHMLRRPARVRREPPDNAGYLDASGEWIAGARDVEGEQD